MNAYTRIAMSPLTITQDKQKLEARIYGYPTEPRFENESYYVRMEVSCYADLCDVGDAVRAALDALNGYLKEPPPMNGSDNAAESRG